MVKVFVKRQDTMGACRLDSDSACSVIFQDSNPSCADPAVTEGHRGHTISAPLQCLLKVIQKIEGVTIALKPFQ